MKRFFILFVVFLLILFTVELTPPAQIYFVQPWTAVLARISALILELFDPNVISYGKVLQHRLSGIGVSIEAGCNGIEACLLLTAAILAYTASWRLKIAGILLGFVAIQSINVLRVITLFYLAGWNDKAFEFAHLYLWQALIMLDVLVVWLIWIRQVAKREVHHEVVV